MFTGETCETLQNLLKSYLSFPNRRSCRIYCSKTSWTLTDSLNNPEGQRSKTLHPAEICSSKETKSRIKICRQRFFRSGNQISPSSLCDRKYQQEIKTTRRSRTPPHAGWKVAATRRGSERHAVEKHQMEQKETSIMMILLNLEKAAEQSHREPAGQGQRSTSVQALLLYKQVNLNSAGL